MRGKKKLIFFVLLFSLAVFILKTPYASEQTNEAGIPEVFQMKAAYEHKKGIVTFAHAKHIKEYELGCGECHHDDQGQPLSNLQMSDQVQRCIECHTKPGVKPKDKDAPKLSKKEKLAYNAEALHYNCKDCHKAFNKKNGTNSAPTACTKCHLKKRPAAPTGLVIKVN